MSERKDPMDILLRMWSDANCLSRDEAQAMRNGVADNARAPEFDLSWWQDCLSAGLEPMKASLTQLNSTLYATMNRCFMNT